MSVSTSRIETLPSRTGGENFEGYLDFDTVLVIERLRGVEVQRGRERAIDFVI